MANQHNAVTKEANRRIRAFYALGRKSLDREPGRMAYGEMTAEAARFQVSEEILRKSRRFADPERGYSKADLMAILRSWRSASSSASFVLGTTHFIRWLTVPKPKRAKIEQRTISEGWSLTRLEREIAAQFGARKLGGRRRRIPTDSLSILVQLESLCDEWRRWHENLTRDPDEHERKGTAEQLPEKILRPLRLLSKEMGELQVLVETEIQKQRPKRRGKRVGD